jgi:hypothetical protein
MGDQTYRAYTATYYVGSQSSASYNSQDNTFDYRFKLTGGGGTVVTSDFTVQQIIFYPTGSPNTLDWVFTTALGSGTGIGILLVNSSNNIGVFLAGGTRLTLTNGAPRDQWFDLTITKEGSTIKGYINGNLIASSSWASFTAYDAINWGSSGGSLALTNYYIRGASLLVYNRALSQTEIQQNKTSLGARVGL